MWMASVSRYLRVKIRRSSTGLRWARRSSSNRQASSPMPRKLASTFRSGLNVDGKRIKVFASKDPAQLDWTSVGAQIVIESTGKFTDAKEACKHIPIWIECGWQAYQGICE